MNFMKIQEIPFFRDNGWILMPIFYLGLIAVSIGIYLDINASHHNSDYNVASIDGVAINDIENKQNPLYKVLDSSSSEYLEVSTLLDEKSLNLKVRETKLQDLTNLTSFYSSNTEGYIKGVGYLGYSEDDCLKLKAISISKLGTHSMLKVDNGISESLTWESDDFNHVFLNKYLSDGIGLKNSCIYIVSNK